MYDFISNDMYVENKLSRWNACRRIPASLDWMDILSHFIGSSNIEMGKKWYENIIFSFIYAIISMKVIY